MKKTVLVIAGVLAFAGSLMAITADDAESYIKANASMWLDASSHADFTFDANGKVTAWRNKADKRSTYGDAVAYTVPSHSAAFATRRLNDNRMAVDMGGVNSGIDFKWSLNGVEKRMTGIRTVFLATTMVQSMQAFWLGDTGAYHFHRGEAGQYYASYSNLSGVRQDGTAVANPTTAKTPTDFHVYTVITKSASCSNRMTLDRDCGTYNRHGGRILSEEIVFEGSAVLDNDTIAAIEEYLRRKWRLHGWAETSAAGMTDGKSSDGAEVGMTTGNSATFNALPAFTVGYRQFGFGQINWNCGADVIYSGAYTQFGGIVDAAGGTIKPNAEPVLGGPIAYSNVTFDCTGYSARYRPLANTYITLGQGATIKSKGGLFLDTGNVTLELREGSLVDNDGDVGVTVDYATSNRLYLAGGTLKSSQLVKIMTQNKGGVGVLTMTDGAIQAPRLSIAGSWYSTESVVGTARVDITGGLITLTDNVVIGANSATHGTAYVHFGGGTIIAPNGCRFYYNDTDHINFDGTVFKATKDNANFMILHKSTSSDLTIGPGGFILDDAGFNVGISLATLKGTGAFVKRGAGKVALAAAENADVDVRVETGTLVLADVNAAYYAKSIELAENATLQLNINDSPATQKTFAGKVKLPSTGTATIKVACTDMIPKGVYSISSELDGDLASKLQLVFDGPDAGAVEGNLECGEDGVLILKVTKSNNPGGELVWAPSGSSATWSAKVAAWRQKDGEATLLNYFDGLPLWFDNTAAYQTLTLAETNQPSTIRFTGGSYTMNGGGKLVGEREFLINDATVINTGVVLDNQPIVISNGIYRVEANTSGLLGNSAAAITVKDGGALDVHYDAHWPTLSASAKAKTVYIEGAGPDGNGAYLNSGTYNAWAGDAPKIVLTGDATIGGKSGYRMQTGVTGADYTLTIAPRMEGSTSDGLSGICIDNSAMTVKKLVVDSNANFCFTHNGTSINAAEGVELKPGACFSVWDTTANVTPNFTVKASEDASASAYTLMGCGWQTAKYTGTVTVADGAKLQLGIAGRNSYYDNPEYFYNPLTVQGSGTLKIGGADQFFLKGIVSESPVVFDGAGTAVFGDCASDQSGNVFPAGGFVTASGAHTLYLRPNYLGMKVSAPVKIRLGTTANYVFPQQNVPYGVTDFTADSDIYVMSLGSGYAYANARLCKGATMHLDQLNASNNGALKEGYLAVDGGTLEIGQHGFANTVSPYTPDARLRLNAGKLRSSAAWTMNYGFEAGFYGAANEPFEWEVNYNHTLNGTICGTGPVTLTGSADLTGANARAAGICDGKWTIAKTSGLNNLASASAFSGGLELAEGVTATINLGTDTPGEGYVGMMLSHNASERETVLGVRTDLVFPMMVDRMAYLNGRNCSDWTGNNSCVGYEGEFYVSADNANQKWTFAGGYDDHIAMYVDGKQIFASAHVTPACGTTEAPLTEGWHSFRIMAYDISGNDGPLNNTAGNTTWNAAKMSVGWRVGESTEVNATAYSKFDTDMLRMRPIERTGVLWQQIKNPDKNATWRDANLAWTSASLTNQISFLHTKTVFTKLAGMVSRFSGWFHVSAERAGTWHFWGNWDDNMLVAIDGDDSGITGASATPDATRDFNLKEGWHRFEVRVRDISGGYGPWTGAEAIKVKINGGDWILFDERNFDFMPTHPELKNVRSKAGTLGGELKLGAGSTLVNGSAKTAWITGTLSGTGALSGAFAFTGTNSCWAVTGSGSSRVVDGKATLEVVNGDALSELGKVKATFAQKPGCTVYEISSAMGLTAAAAEAIEVDVKDAAGNDYSENFRASVRDGKLVLVNAKPAGMALFFR